MGKASSGIVFELDKRLDAMFNMDINTDLILLISILLLGIGLTTLLFWIFCKVEELINSIKYK